MQAKTVQPAHILAPMAGISDVVFRSLCESFGADYSISEMASTLPHLIDSKKNKQRLFFTNNQSPNILQLIGNNPDEIANAAHHYSLRYGLDGIDINFGCPSKQVGSQGAGSALLDDLDKVKAIIKAVTEKSTVPVSVKTRLGYHKNKITIFDFLEIAAAFGVKQVTIHARTRACRFRGIPDYDLLAEAKQRTTLPIIANGDIDSLKKAKWVLDHTKCDGVMIGRASVGNPWLFAELKGVTINHNHRKATAIQHIKDLYEHYNAIASNRYANQLARKHIQAYLKYFFKGTQNDSSYQESIRDILTCQDESTQLNKLADLLNP